MRRILGIDPGTRFLGVGCIEKKGQKLRYVHAQVIQAPASWKLMDRLTLIYETLDPLIESLCPDEVAIEDIFISKNPRGVFHLGLSRGLAIALCIKQKKPVFEYPPTEVKSVVTGFGRATKDQVKKMTELSLGVKINLKNDATDALAVAICHAARLRLTIGPC